MKSKGDVIRSKLPMIVAWRKQGLSEKQISKKVGVNESTMNSHKKKSPELVKALATHKEVKVTELENLLFKRAMGYDYTETKTHIRIENGREVKYTEKTLRHMPPEVAACFLLLKNKDRGNWSADPMMMELRRQNLVLTKKAVLAKAF